MRRQAPIPATNRRVVRSTPSGPSDRPDLVEDYGHRGLHRTTVNGKAITTAFYGAPPEYSYYTGCSKGGLQGLMEAQRYPDDYDGNRGRQSCA